MSYQPLYISNYEGGLVTNREPFLLPEDAFPILTNAYLFRGRVVERQALRRHGRLRRELTASSLGNTGASPWSFNIFTLLGLAATEPNASVSVNDPQIAFEINLNAGAEIFTEPSPADGTLTSSVSGPNSGTINYETGDVTLTHTVGAGVAASITMAYFPGLPVMGLPSYEVPAVNDEDLIGFDTKYAYRFSAALNLWQEWIPGTTWNGNNSNFFWSYNYWQDAATNASLLWATNFNAVDVVPARDPIRYSNGTAWTNFTPLITATENVFQCRAIVAYKGRLLFFNTFEGTTAGGIAAATQFPQRLRYSQNGDPLAANAWRTDITGNGGFIDAPTNEHIINVSFIRDILIVRFERSTWQVRYTGNEILPFVFEKINTELGSESTFSFIQLDTAVIDVGQRSINGCNGNSVERIDLKIPDLVFQINNDNQGTRRVYGVRDFRNEIIYWTYPNSDESPIFPNRVLLFNYRENNWAVFRDTLTCFGYFQPSNDVRWQDLSSPQDIWENFQQSWGSFINQSQFQFIVAGNQQGYTFLYATTAYSGNAPQFHIQAIATAPGLTTITSNNHNLSAGEFIELSGLIGASSVLNGERFQVQTTPTADTFTIATPLIGAGLTYFGGGQITFINNIEVRSKRFNLLQAGTKLQLGWMDVLCDVASDGEFTIDILLDENESTPINDGSDTFFNREVTTAIEEFQTPGQNKSWHRVFFNVEGQFITFRVRYNENQMLSKPINSSPIVLHSFILWILTDGQLL